MATERRQFQREKHRISCEFKVEGHTHRGIVTDISARGVFVNSSHAPEDGVAIDLVLHEVGTGDIALRGRVSRLQASHRAAAAVVTGGFGVEVESAPENFFELLVQLGLA